MALDRRSLLKAAALASLAGPAHAIGPAAPRPGVGPPGWRTEPVRLSQHRLFSFDTLRRLAAAKAQSPHDARRSPYTTILEEIGYDAYQRIRYRPDATLDIGGIGVQLFHLGKQFQEPVRIHVIENGFAREVLYDARLFDMPADHIAHRLPRDTGFAGFRLMAPDLQTDWMAFLGASYFRSSGPFDQYGLSARGLAIDMGLARPEEFPRFSEFWLEPDEDGAMTVYALLESQSLTGAYRMSIRRATDARGVHTVVQDIDCEIIARRRVERLGIAPFSSMYWYGETNRGKAVDWRPEIHDSDGLSVHTGAGERLWRPLNNPPRTITSSLADRSVRGFGLEQRDRNVANYQDDGVFYERRASVWIEPKDGWGDGAVVLLEIPTDDEIHDNIAACWSPAEPLAPGQTGRWSYRLSWLDAVPLPPGVARTVATFSGKGGRPAFQRPPGVRKFVVDFEGDVFRALGREDGVELVVTASHGAISNAYSHPVVGQPGRWRAFFDIEAKGANPVELRAFLRRNGQALTETWLMQHHPEPT